MVSEYLRLGRIVDLFTSFFSSDGTVSDKSGNGLDATLLSGRYVELDAASDTIDYATAYISGDRTATVMMRVTSLGNRTLGAFTFSPTATGVWELLTAPDVTVSGDLSWTAGSDCDISDLRIYEDGVEVDRWIHAELESGDPDGLPVANSIRPLATGTYTGGSFSSGEPTILQTAGMDFNEYSWFNGTDTSVSSTKILPLVGALTVKFRFSSTEGVVFYSQASANQSSQGFSITESRTAGNVHVTFHIARGTFTNISQSGFSEGDWITCTAYFNFTTDTYSIDVNGLSGDGILAGRYPEHGPFFLLGTEATSTYYGEDIIYALTLFDTDQSTPILNWTGYGKNPWKDTIGSNDGTESGTFLRPLVPVSDTDPTLDAYGNALTFQRTPKTLNLTDGASAQIAAPVPDTIKTVADWIWNDGTAQTHIDGGNWTVGSTGTDLTSTGFTGVAYFVQGESGTTLVAGWNHVMVASTAALTTTDIDFTNVQEHFLAYITTEGADTALQNYTTTKSDYGL